MKHQNDASVLKSLAVAFGDGLAFAVGMKLAQAGPKKRAEIAPIAPPAAPVAAPAPAPAAAESLDLHLLSNVIASVDAKLNQHLAKVERRLAESEAQTTEALKAQEGRQPRPDLIEAAVE